MSAIPPSTGDYLDRLEHHLGAYHEDDDSECIDNPVAYRWLTVGDQRAAVAELKRLRMERESFAGRLRHAYRAGWDGRGEVVVKALRDGSGAAAELRGEFYVKEWHGSLLPEVEGDRVAPQWSEREGSAGYASSSVAEGKTGGST